jgi:predicted nuclease of restriction endonuclease-like (RecB) superfamily
MTNSSPATHGRTQPHPRRVKKKPREKAIWQTPSAEYGGLIGGIAELLETARRTAARTVNALMTATYWEIGRRIVEFEQSGEKRAAYGEELLRKLSADLVSRFGRGFSRQNLQRFRQFYLSQPAEKIRSTLSSELPGKIRATLSLDSGEATIEQAVSAKSDPPLICSTPSSISETPSRIFQTPSGKSSTPPFALVDLARVFPLPWSHYVLLISRSRSREAFAFYHAEALRGGWSVRQLDRQIASQFYERTALARNKEAMLRKGAVASAGDSISADEEVRDPLVLEFLGLKDEYSESDLEEALLRHLESFLLELGGDFAFVARQRRLRIGGEWYRVDLLFFHRKLRCLVVIDLKVGKFTHADAGQMHLYLNYAREHWTQPDENPPVGLILCAEKDDAIARYALEGLPNKVLAREYKLALPDEKRLAAEIEKTRERLERKGRK